jgi:magnesium chelatase subunit D
MKLLYIVFIRVKDGRMKQGFALYPFSAVVGQEKMKRALLINAVDFRIGGLLIRGERGTGKSTAVRAVSDLLPQIETIVDCPFSCDPHNQDEMCSSCLSRSLNGEPLPIATRPMRLVTLPLNASEDRVVGTLDLEKAVKEGSKDFEPGILAEANRSLLYVDEVNLLEDHIVDILLDAAAMGVNIVEREGISYSHPSSFIMVGTMNPEEGDLRPQLEDRFGLCVEVSGEKDTTARMEVVRRRQSYLDDPQYFRLRFQPLQEELSDKILRARELLPRVEMPDRILILITSIAVELGVCGHRADIATSLAARALAALDGSRRVEDIHVREAAEMALLHRLKKTPFDDQFKDLERLERIIARKGKLIDLPRQGNSPVDADPVGTLSVFAGDKEKPVDPQVGNRGADIPELACDTPALKGASAKALRNPSGRRSSAITESCSGKKVGYRMPRSDEETGMENLAVDATLRAAAARTAGKDAPFSVQKEDLRKSIRRRKVCNLILFILDASASMGCQERIESTKQVVDRLLIDAYQKRDRVGLVTFRDESAQLALAPTSSLQLARLRIKELATGGATPLNHGLTLGYQVAKREMRRNSDVVPLLVLISDGHGNVGYASDNPLKESMRIAEKIREDGLSCVVFDTCRETHAAGAGRSTSTQARRIAVAMGAEYHRLPCPQPQEMLKKLNRKMGV